MKVELFLLFFALLKATAEKNSLAKSEVVFKVNGRECVPGEKKPLDLMFIFDTSGSVGKQFSDQMDFVKEVVDKVNIHPRAVRVSMLSFSSFTEVNFFFNKYDSNKDVKNYLRRVRPQSRRTTKTTQALLKAIELFDKKYGSRDHVEKMAIVLTDGHANRDPSPVSRRLMKLANVIVVAVAATNSRFVDDVGLLRITNNRRDRVFSRKSGTLVNFDSFFSKYFDKKCNGKEVTSRDKPVILDAVSSECSSRGLKLTVRTAKPFTGYIYGKKFVKDRNCLVSGRKAYSTTINFREGYCGMEKRLSKRKDGFYFDVAVRIQFHDDVITGDSVVRHVSCFYKARVPHNWSPSIENTPEMIKCDYTLHRRDNPSSCVALSGVVGDPIFHKWQCHIPIHYEYLVHDCSAIGGRQSVKLIDDRGCVIEPNLMSPPYYGYTSGPFVSGKSFLMKFPGESTIKYKCSISICNMNSIELCTYMFRDRYIDCATNVSVKNKGFAATVEVETRELTAILDIHEFRQFDVQYCARGVF